MRHGPGAEGRAVPLTCSRTACGKEDCLRRLVESPNGGGNGAVNDAGEGCVQGGLMAIRSRPNDVERMRARGGSFHVPNASRGES